MLSETHDLPESLHNSSRNTISVGCISKCARQRHNSLRDVAESIVSHARGVTDSGSAARRSSKLSRAIAERTEMPSRSAILSTLGCASPQRGQQRVPARRHHAGVDIIRRQCRHGGAQEARHHESRAGPSQLDPQHNEPNITALAALGTRCIRTPTGPNRRRGSRTTCRAHRGRQWFEHEHVCGGGSRPLFSSFSRCLFVDGKQTPATQNL